MSQCVSFNAQTQVEARRLKSVYNTKVIALGIGASLSELRYIVSEPSATNAILVDFNSLSNLNNFEERLKSHRCTGLLCYYYYQKQIIVKTKHILTAEFHWQHYCCRKQD